MATATNRVDDLVKDYLLFRGLTVTLKTLESELKTDKEKGLRADKIVEQLQTCITNSDLVGLRDYWTFLNQRLFRRLEQQYMSSVKRLEFSIHKLYVVTAFQANRQDKVTEFFDKLVQISDAQTQDQFRDWFAFPFMKNPEENPTFQLYFNKQWQETLMLSLYNFLSVILQSMPVPILLNFEFDHKTMKNLQEENRALREQIRNTCESGNMTNQGGKTNTDSRTTNEHLEVDFLAHSEESTNANVQEKQKTGRFLPFGKKKTETTTQPKVEKPRLATKAKPIVSKTAPLSAPITTTKKILSSQRQHSTTSVATPSSDLSSSAPKVKSQIDYNKQRKELLGKEKKTPEKVQRGIEVEIPSVNTTPKKTASVSELVKGEGVTVGSLNIPLAKSSPIEMTVRDGSTIPDGDCPFLLLSQEEYGEHHSAISNCRFSASGQYVASSDVDGIVKVWTWSPQPATISSVMSRAPFLSLEWANKSDRYLLLGNRTGYVRLFDVKDNKTMKEVVVDPEFPRIIHISSNPAGGSFVCSVAAQRIHSFPNPSETGSMSKPGKLYSWDLKTMKLEKQIGIEPEPIAVNCSSYNHNGQLLVTGAADGRIRLYDMKDCRCICQWEAHTGEVNSVQFSSDETACYSMGTDGKFVKWSIHKNGAKLEELPIHQGANLPFLATSPTGNKELPRGKLFSFDAEGQYILTCAKNVAVIYQVSEDVGIKKTMELKGHKNSITTVDWSPSIDTRVGLAGAMDGKIKVSTLLPQ